MTAPVAATKRDEIKDFSPSWLRRGTAGALLYSFGVVLDALLESATAGVKSRFPGYYSEDSLVTISRERRIRRGLFETSETFAGRLAGWLDAHQTRGGPYAMLRQLHAFFAPNNFPIELVYYSGRRFSLAEDGTITRDEVAGDAPSWPPDAEATQWARWWLFYYVPGVVVDDGTWDESGEWDDGGVWDSGLTVQEVADYRVIPTEWNAKHTLGRVVLLSDGMTIEDWLAGDPGTAEIWIGS